MKDQAKQIISNATTPDHARLLLREFLQHVILRQLFEQKKLQDWVFHGGTALRVLYGLNRFSEYLDFHLKNTNENIPFTDTIGALCHSLDRQGYSVSTPRIRESIVCNATIRFESLLFESGLSHHRDEKLAVKIECDTNPPDGYKLDRSLINKYHPFSLVHHDPATFMAGKIHALLQRPFTKGRDYYDIMFLLSRWPELQPNIKYLANALQQTGYKGKEIANRNWRSILRQLVKEAKWNVIISDVEPFLENSIDIQMLTPENL